MLMIPAEPDIIRLLFRNMKNSYKYPVSFRLAGPVLEFILPRIAVRRRQKLSPARSNDKVFHLSASAVRILIINPHPFGNKLKAAVDALGLRIVPDLRRKSVFVSVLRDPAVKILFGARMMKLTREAIKGLLREWNIAWENHDLDGVMKLFHDKVLFENWTGGKAVGKEALRKAWEPWFSNHGGFRFIEEETFIDEKEQKVLYRWQLQWPSFEKGYEGKPEIRRGVDVIHFQDGKIIKKLTYSKTTIEIDGKRGALHVSE